MNRTMLEFPEPERYELREGPYYHFEISRRAFGQLLGAGLLLSIPVSRALAQRSGRGGPQTLAQRLHIGVEGDITVLTGKVEVGQGSRTELTQAAAEELCVSVERIRLVMADSDVVPNDGGTAGSRTTPSTVPSVRQGCAAARQLLLQTAAERFKADASTLSVRDGQVQGLGANQNFGYTDLAGEEEAFKRNVPRNVELTPTPSWKVMGTHVPKVGSREIATGAHRYPSDIRRPGMLYAAVLRPPSYGATLESIDLAPARAHPGVTAVHDGDFVGCAGPTSLEARNAVDAAGKTAVWKETTHRSSDTLFEDLRAAAGQRNRENTRGNPAEALEKGHRVLRATYHVPYIQHAPMEPRAAVAEWDGDRLTVWTGTQQPDRVRGELARAFQMPEARVRLIVPDTGGGFGGRHTGEAALEAARLAREAGRPVSLRWTREAEFTWAYFRPAGVMDLEGALDAEGKLTGWTHVNFNSGASALETPYAVPHVRTGFKNCDQPLRSGSYRALAATANTFAREAFMDELAAAQGADPLEFRLRHLENDRMRAVLEAAAAAFDWKGQWKAPAGPQTTGIGLSCGTEKGSYTACCARVRVDRDAGTYRVTDVCQAFECGAIVNPGNLQAQVEGCLIQGLGAVLREEIRFRDGRVLGARFSRYEVPRFRDVPAMKIVLVNRPDLPSVGGSETPIIGIAPAVANAMAHAVQVRLRALPLRDATWKAAGSDPNGG